MAVAVASSAAVAQIANSSPTNAAAILQSVPDPFSTAPDVAAVNSAATTPPTSGGGGPVPVTANPPADPALCGALSLAATLSSVAASEAIADLQTSTSLMPRHASGLNHLDVGQKLHPLSARQQHQYPSFHRANHHQHQQLQQSQFGDFESVGSSPISHPISSARVGQGSSAFDEDDVLAADVAPSSSTSSTTKYQLSSYESEERNVYGRCADREHFSRQYHQSTTSLLQQLQNRCAASASSNRYCPIYEYYNGGIQTSSAQQQQQQQQQQLSHQMQLTSTFVIDYPPSNRNVIGLSAAIDGEFGPQHHIPAPYCSRATPAPPSGSRTPMSDSSATASAAPPEVHDVKLQSNVAVGTPFPVGSLSSFEQRSLTLDANTREAAVGSGELGSMRQHMYLKSEYER